jgi:hypothetical protein
MNPTTVAMTFFTAGLTEEFTQSSEYRSLLTHQWRDPDKNLADF